MPALLPNTTTTDDYRDCVLGGDRGYAYGTLTVANNPVSILLAHGSRASPGQTEYEFVTPSTLPLVGIVGRDEIVGAQVKSAIPGTPAQVSGWLVEPNVAGLQPGSAYTSQVSAAGNVSPPGGNAMQVIATQTVPGIGQASFDFAGITQVYSHLELVVIARGSDPGTDVAWNLQCNGDAGANYDWQRLTGLGAVASAAVASAQTSIRCGRLAAAGAPAGASTTTRITMPGYTLTTLHKAVNVQTGMRFGAASLLAEEDWGLYRSLLAISRLTLAPDIGVIAAGVATLYGLPG